MHKLRHFEDLVQECLLKDLSHKFKFARKMQYTACHKV